MRSPLVPFVIVLALLIFLGESLFGCFSLWLDPSRSASHYSHHVVTPPSGDGDGPRAPEQWLRVRLDEFPAERERSLRCEAEVLEIADTTGEVFPCHGKILLYLQKADSNSTKQDVATYQKGDILLLFVAPQPPDAGLNPHQFNYRQYLRHKGVLFTAFVPETNLRLLSHSTSGLGWQISALRQRLISVIQSSTLSPSQKGIAEALFLGWDNDLDPDTESNFRQAGITHLLCVSGLHVGIVALMAGWLLFFLSNRRRHRIIRGLFQIAATWFFVILTGMAPGTMRAGLMFSFIIVGQMFFTRPTTLNAIAASAVILLTSNPLLLFDVGFQLSYCSVVGIVLFTRPLEEKLPLPTVNSPVLLWLLQKVRSLFCVSIVAQLVISPLVLYYFHQFPVYFLVANMTVVPFAGLILGTAMLMAVTSWWPWLFKTLASLLSAELSATEWVTGTVASWPHAMIENIWFDGWMLFIAAIIVTALGFFLLHGIRQALPFALLMAIIMAGYARFIESRCDKQQHFDIYRLGNRTAMEFFIGHESVLLCDSNIAANPASIDFQTKNNRLWRQCKTTHIISLDSFYEDHTLLICNRFVGFAGKTMRIVDRSNYRQQCHTVPRLNYLFLRESPYITIGELMEQYDFDTIIIGSQNSWLRRRSWRQECDSLGVPYRQ